VYGAEDTTIELGTTTIAPEDQGRDCVVSVTVTNESRWPETNLILESDEGYTTAENVEDAKGTYTVPMGHLVLGPTVTGRLQFGPGEASSIQGEFGIVCPDVPPATTPPPTLTPPPPVPVEVPARFTG
jgi:hypothetical protein